MRRAKSIAVVVVVLIGLAAAFSLTWNANGPSAGLPSLSLPQQSPKLRESQAVAPASSPFTPVVDEVQASAIKAQPPAASISPSTAKVQGNTQPPSLSAPTVSPIVGTSPVPRVSLGVPLEVETKFGPATWMRMEDDDNPLDIGIPSAKRVIERQEVLSGDYWYQSFLETAPTFILSKNHYIVQLNKLRSTSLFEKMGFRNGDRIESINGIESQNVMQIPYMISRLSLGQECLVMLERQGKSFGLSVQPFIGEDAADSDSGDIDAQINNSYRNAAEKLLSLTSESAPVTEALEHEQNSLVKEIYRDMAQRQPQQ